VPAARARLLAVAAAGTLCALVPALILRDFTVDDALITARYAHHLARGLGYRFNAAGPITDGVTPLGFPYLLAPFAGSGPLAALAAAKALGLAAWTAAAAVLAVAVDRASTARLRFAALALIACSAPLAAWSVAGMETGVVAALAALAVALPDLGLPLGGVLAGGLLAALRPEALPFALVLGLAPAPRAWPWRLLAAAAPFALVAATRFVVFGRVIPLSALAKPSDAAHGWAYAGACFLLTGPVAIVAPLAFARASGRARALVIAVAAHFAAVAFAGGDWMPLSRLVVPALPATALAFAHLAGASDARAGALRLALALSGEIFQVVRVGPAAAKVGSARAALITELRGPLAGAKTIAALDIGWLGAATEATIVDLAGVTDPEIAVLRGGHTSKAVPVTLLDARGVDALVLLVREGEPLEEPWTRTFFARHVELRVASIPGMDAAFSLAYAHRATNLRYLVVRRVTASGPGS
jgi:hypothetical protein